MKDVGFYSSYYIANCVFNAWAAYTASMLNCVTIHAIRKTSSLPRPLKTLLLSLAVSDLGVGLLVQPLYIALLVMELKPNAAEINPVYRATFTVAFLIPANLLVFVSLFGVMALSVDRFLAIHLHLRYQELVTHKRVVAAVISIWVLGAILSLVRLWTPVNITYVIFAIICTGCIIGAAFLNYRTFKVVRRHAHHLQDLQVQQVAQNREIVNDRRLTKSAVTTIYLYLLFLFCYLPNTCILWIITIRSEPLSSVIQRTTMTLMFLNSALNPLIYSWKLRDIRRAAMNILQNVFSSHN